MFYFSNPKVRSYEPRMGKIDIRKESAGWWVDGVDTGWPVVRQTEMQGSRWHL